MIKIKELSDPNSCINRASSGEMLFVLRSHDISAPDTIRAWVMYRLREKKNYLTDPEIREALACADEMERQRKSNEL